MTDIVRFGVFGPQGTGK